MPYSRSSGCCGTYSISDVYAPTRDPKRFSDTMSPVTAHNGIHEGVGRVKGAVGWSGSGSFGLGSVGRGAGSIPRSGVRRFGAWASIRSAPAWRVVCMERYGHSVSWAQSHISTRNQVGVMPLGELATGAVPEPFMPPR
jgi:hypothetical protein